MLQVNDFISQGLGKNKKTAKQIAAKNMWSLLEERKKLTDGVSIMRDSQDIKL